MNELLKIINVVGESILNVYPYLLVTIPLSVIVNVSGVSKYINKAVKQKPVVAIILATIIGAFSPFCSCGVIPIITSLLIGGVPLAPVMAFWVASPSMDPEIFFLSVGMIGWNLALWRFGATLTLSLSAGFVTHYLAGRNWFGDILKVNNKKPSTRKIGEVVRGFYNRNIATMFARTNPVHETVEFAAVSNVSNCSSCSPKVENLDVRSSAIACGCENDPIINDSKGCCENAKVKSNMLHLILKETWDATYLVVKFMSFAFLIKALITLYVPDSLVLGLLGESNVFSVLIATIIGIPFYTSNIAALPIISGFLEQGMDSGAALAFLIAGPITTLPAMAAVWGIVNKKVFIVYLLVPLVGAIIAGYIFNLFI